MKGDEGAIFSKAPDRKPLFLLKIKIKQYDRSYWEESEQSEVLVNKFALSQTHMGSLGGVAMPGKFCDFGINLGNGISSTYTDKKLLFKYEHFFFLTPLFYKHTVPERLSAQSNKI